MKIPESEIQEEIKNSTKEQDIIRRIFDIIKESHWDDHKLISTYCKSFSLKRSLGADINAIVQKSFPKWYTKQLKIHKAKDKIMSLDDESSAKALEVKNNDYVISLPFIIPTSVPLSSYAIEKYMRTVNKGLGFIDVTISSFQDQTLNVNLENVCALIQKIDWDKQQIELRVLADTPRGEELFLLYCSGGIIKLKMVVVGTSEQITGIIKVTASYI